MVDKNEGLGIMPVDDIFGNRVDQKHASYCYFSLVNTWHTKVSVRNQDALPFCSRN